MEIEHITLPNSLRVLLIDTKGASSATVLVLVRSGSRYEDATNNGIAHFFEHMAFKGSAKYPDSFTISSTIEGMGGVCNAFTSKDHTGYWIKGTTAHLGTMLDVLADMLTASKLEAVEIEKEKGVIVEEINMYEDMPQHKVSNVYEALLYPKHPLGMDIAGSKKTVTSFTRQTFTDYIQRLYHPENATLVIAGGIGAVKQELAQMVKKSFGVWLANPNPAADYSYPRFEQQARNVNRDMFTKKTEQAHFIFGYATDYGYLDTRKHRLGVLAGVLGGGMSSRLFMEIREKRGLCYYIHTARDLYAETGALSTAAGIRNSAQAVNEAIKIVMDEHQKIAQGTAEKDKLAADIARVKEMLKGRLLLSLENSQSVASFYGTKLLLEGKTQEPKDVIAALDAVTLEDVVQEAQAIVQTARLRFALVGPFAESDIVV
ncbi:MAG TPA: pitrilysin family protein [Candidatus Woesebacteria bacterium]|nr:pitrilysin family protein [Candidatus Woesebacteria bacterium]HNS95028.1 pitrilysin family protein [Candidatus Woesebacteria bacterium]